MSKQGVLRKRGIISEEVSRNVDDWGLDQQKGVGEEFARLSSEYLTFVMIDSLPSGIQDIPMAINWGGYHRIPNWLLASLVSVETNFIAPDVATIEEEFAELTNRWHEETDFLSSPSSITSNENYLKIISMGKRVIPMILKDLKERGGIWYQALGVLSGEDPVPIEALGDVEQMKEAWLQWGKERGYIE